MKIFPCLLFSCVWAINTSYAQQEEQQEEENRNSINILLLSTSVDTRDAHTVDPNPYSSWTWYNDFSAPSSGAFVDGSEIVREFLQIAQGSTDDITDSINVEYQDIYSTAWQDFETIRYTVDQVVHATNLFSWFHWPHPADVETTTRWPDLRGEQETAWDYIVLIEDRYTMEHMPGLYAQGVASIMEEVNKGTAKLVLFLNWPDPEKSTSSVEHYREIVHRVGQSAGGGGLTVAPGALAWQAAGQPMDEEAQAYIAAATLFATLFDQSASTSSYGTQTYHDYADVAYQKVIEERDNPPPFQPRYNSPNNNPFKMLFDTRRDVGFSRKESSTESGYHEAAVRAVTRAGAQPHNSRGPAWFLQRASIYNLIHGQYEMLYAFYYQNIDSRNDNHVSEIVDGDMSLVDDMITFSEGLDLNPNPLRIVPRRILWGLFHKVQNEASPRGSYPHVSQSASDLCGNYMYTLFSGRCTMGSSNTVWEERIGYEAAWRIGNVQVRASGFQVLPSRIIQRSVSEKHPETIRIRFRIQPQANVTVTIAASVPEAVNITPSTQLTFTPSNYDTIQTIQIQGNMEQRGTSFDVIVSTQSEDVVYDQLEDRWEYEVNDYPELEVSCCNDTVIVANESTPGSTCVKAATFDFEEDQLSIQWEMESGPGDITFSDPAAQMPTVTFPHAGTYVLKVSVSDGYTTVSDNSLMIEVRPEDTNYLPAMDETENPFALGDVHYDRFRARGGSTTSDSILDGPTYYTPFDYSGTTKEGFKLLNTTGNFGYRFRGYLDVPISGYYSFYLESYRGCKMYIGSNREFVLDNQGWPVEEDSNTVGLEAGKHFIELGYIYIRPHWGTPTPRVTVSWSGPGFAKQVLEAKDRLYRLIVEESEAEVSRASDSIGTNPDTKPRSTPSPTTSRQSESSVAPTVRGNAAGGRESDGDVEQKKNIGEYDLWT